MLSDLQIAALAPMVAKALNQPSVEIVAWELQPMAAGGSQLIGSRLYRCDGTARHHNDLQSWSLIVKSAKRAGEWATDDPTRWNYWKREVLAYQSGILDHLPGGIVAPRCYAVEEQPDGEYWLWLEEIHSPSTIWSMAQHHQAARHLGEFNGAYLVGQPLPQWQAWMLWGRARQWAELAQPLAARAPLFADTPIARRWFGKDGVEPLLTLWAQVPLMLQAFERLPVCYCHHDAFRRNLLDRPTQTGSSETVAIDWSMTGYGRIGEEVGLTTAVNLNFVDVSASQAHELDQAIFTGYLTGLHNVGWRGDVRQVRLGYTVNAFTTTVSGWLFYLESLQSDEGRRQLEAIIHKPVDEIIEQWAGTYLFILALGAEALTLLESGNGG